MENVASAKRNQKQNCQQKLALLLNPTYLHLQSDVKVTIVEITTRCRMSIRQCIFGKKEKAHQPANQLRSYDSTQSTSKLLKQAIPQSSHHTIKPDIDVVIHLECVSAGNG